MENLSVKCERLVIKTFTEDMAEDVHQNSLDANNRKFVPDEVFETVGDAKETIHFLISCYKNDAGPLAFPILLNSGENIGYIQIVPLDKEKWEIGYHIAEKFTGKGYATEALKAFLPIILQYLGVSEVWGICHGENIASHKVLEKCSFVLYSNGLGNYKGENCFIKKYLYVKNDCVKKGERYFGEMPETMQKRKQINAVRDSSVL